ncbi:MAG: hypothetical protein H0V46_03070 [Sphingomonas sp.]|nr:hypothetical protein [Sphingomonas sp.]
MMRSLVPLIAAAALPLGGCVAGMAAGAAGMAAKSIAGEAPGNDHLRPVARQACEAHAARYGAVHIIDVEQRSAARIIVWGTVGEGAERRSFECAYGTRMIGFKLRAITPSR